MPQLPKPLTPELSARHRFGAELRLARVRRQISQAEVATRVFVHPDYIAKVEKALRWPSHELAAACDQVLETGGALLNLWPSVDAERRASRQVQSQRAALVDSHQSDPRPLNDIGGFWRNDSATHRGSRALAVLNGQRNMSAGQLNWSNISGATQQVELFTLPAGRYFPGTDLEVRIYPAVFDGRVRAQLPSDYSADAFIARNRRGLVIGAVPESSGQTLYGLDTRHVRRKTSGCIPGRKLLIPHAYLLDEITVGLLWAIASFDEALLDDDRILVDHVERLSNGANLERSATSLATAADLSTPSAMWLGSEFCARHILRNVDALAQTPTFWTREQRGEEASAWLLFAHKYAYLERLRQLFPGGMTRSFCVPESTVGASTASERVLLLLVAALMESFDIHCLVTSEPEYSAVDGFVLDAERRAIVANWVGTDRVWYVDVTGARSAVREYADANGHVRSHSAIAASTPVARLQALTAYLGLSWPLITRRCAELAAYGLSGIAEPRSRLLSLAGAERACRYLGDLAPADGR